MKPTICFAHPNELHKLRRKTSFVHANINGLSDILSDFEIPMKMVALISSRSDPNAYLRTASPTPDADKENVSPLDSPDSSFSSVDDDTDSSGKPLPLQKVANLSVVTSGIPLDQLFDRVNSSVRQIYSFGLADRLSELKARQLLSSLIPGLKQNSLPPWMPDGLAIIVPFADQAPSFTSIACCLLVYPTGIIKSIKVKCSKENIPRSQLPELQKVKGILGRMMARRSKEEPRERYETAYSLGAVNKDDGGCHVTVRYTAKWEACLRLLGIPSRVSDGQLLVRPLFGHPKSELYFISQNIQRLKVLSAAVSADAREWGSDVDMDSFSKTMFSNFRQLCRMSGSIDKQRIIVESDSDADVACSLLTDPSSPAPRWRNIVARRKRDLSEVLWIVARDVDSHKRLRQVLQSLLRYLIKEKLPYSVDRSNDTGLALVLRRLMAHGVPDFSNGLELLIEVGFYALHRDLVAVLGAVLEAHTDVLRDLQPMLDFFAEEGTTMRDERLRRLGHLYRACEFAALLGQHSPGRDIGRNVRQIFNVLKKDAVDELVFTSVSPKSLSLDRDVPTSWSVTLEYSNGLIMKQIFKRCAHEVINTHDPSFAKFTCLEVQIQNVSCL